MSLHQSSSRSSSQCDIIFGKTKIAIERSLCTDIGKIISTPVESTKEIEVRFGYVMDGKNRSGLSSNPIESRERWYFLLKLLKNSGLYNKPEIEKTSVESYGELRKIINLGIPSKTEYQKKQRIKSVDMLNYMVGSLTHRITLNVSSEIKQLPKDTPGKPDYYRVRTRVSFNAIDGSHRIDLTYVSDDYEVEIEYLKVMDKK